MQAIIIPNTTDNGNMVLTGRLIVKNKCDCNIIVVSRILLVVNKNFFHLQFFDLIVKIINYYEINNIQKSTPFWHEMVKIASVSGALPQPPFGELTTLPRPPNR